MDTIYAVIIAIASTMFITNLGIHKIEEGHVGVYYRVSIFGTFYLPVELLVKPYRNASYSAGRRTALRNKSTRLSHDGPDDNDLQTRSSTYLIPP